MKCAILTFCSAHNYGAVLQATALKKYIESMGHVADIIGYAPDSIANIYSMNPFIQTKSWRSRAKRFLILPHRIKQYKLFKEFICQYVKDNLLFSDNHLLSEKFNDYDVVICGSDQIWNDKITGNSSAYFLDWVSNPKTIKVSYAASFGTKVLSDTQRKNVKSYLPSFDRISLREEDGLAYVKERVLIDPKIVLDPVFLLSREDWAKEGCMPKSVEKDHFILYYSLSSNEELACKANEFSEYFHLPILAIHPIATKQKVNGRQLYDVGPREFVGLINSADFVCTDSFHATAFSMIFKKKYIHVVKEDKETRVESLLKRACAYSSKMALYDNCYYLDFAEMKETSIGNEIDVSCSFLKEVLEM